MTMAKNEGKGNELLTLREAARELGLSYDATLRWAQRGELKARRTAERGMWVLTRADLEHFRAWWKKNQHAQWGQLATPTR